MAPVPVPLPRVCAIAGCERITFAPHSLCRACESSVLSQAFGPAEERIERRLGEYVGARPGLARFQAHREEVPMR